MSLPKTLPETVEQFGQLTDAKKAVVEELLQLLHDKVDGNALLMSELAEHITGTLFLRILRDKAGLSAPEYLRFISGNFNLRLGHATQTLEDQLNQQKQIIEALEQTARGLAKKSGEEQQAEFPQLVKE